MPDTQQSPRRVRLSFSSKNSKRGCGWILTTALQVEFLLFGIAAVVLMGSLSRRKLYLTPGFVDFVAQNTKMKSLLQLAPDVRLMSCTWPK
jgi:hypothetical protein